MTAQVLFFNVYSEKDPHLNAVEQKLKGYQPSATVQTLSKGCRFFWGWRGRGQNFGLVCKG